MWPSGIWHRVIEWMNAFLPEGGGGRANETFLVTLHTRYEGNNPISLPCGDVTGATMEGVNVIPYRLQRHVYTTRLAAVSEKCSLERGALSAGRSTLNCSTVDEQELCIYGYGLLGCHAP
jgi:hypothetical protein